MKLVLVDATGVQHEALIENIVGVPRIDGVDVAPDGSICVSFRNDVVHRFFLDDATQISTDAIETFNDDAGSKTAIVVGGDDAINGLGGDDQLEGGAGDDTLSGGVGVDTLLKGEGQDTAIFGDVFDSFDVSENDIGFLRIAKTSEVGEALAVGAFQFVDVTVTREEALTSLEPLAHAGLD